MIATQRRLLADLLSGLSDGEWATSSLCSGWTVREVAAHLTMAFDLSKLSLVVQVVKAGGNYDKVADRYAKTAAAAPPSTLVATLRANAESRFTPPGLGPEAPLTDIVVHGLDIGVPVGKVPPLPAESANTVLGFLVSPKATRGFVRKGLVAGLRCESSDSGWAAGSGPSVSGTAQSLVLALTGRRAGLAGLAGEGAGDLARRLG